MGKLLTVCSQKGGTGKTTVGLNLGAAFASSGRRVMLVDADPQASAAVQLGEVYRLGEHSLAECIDNVVDGVDPETAKAVRPTESGIDVLGPSGNLEGVTDRLVTYGDYPSVLRTILDPVRDNYDIIIIDTPPNLSRLVLMSFAAGPQVNAIGVSNGEPQSIVSLVNIKKRMGDVGGLIEPPGPRWLGTVMNKVDNRRKESFETFEALKDLKTKPFDTIIPNHIHVVRASKGKLPTVKSSLFAPVTEKFVELTIEISSRMTSTGAEEAS